MNILAIDDERLSLEALVGAIGEAAPGAQVHALRDPEQALAQAKSQPFQVAFVDIQMRGVSGLELARQLKTAQPLLNIVFVTGHPEYALDAFSMHASGYLLKPASCEDVARELRNLRSPIPKARAAGKPRIQTFGNFEVFVGDQPLHFSRAKAKELLAYLVDRRGAACSMAQISAVLWEDQAYGRSQLNQLHTFIAELKKSLGRAGAAHILVKNRNSLAINVDAVDCDYYQFLQGDVHSVNAFAGEYMTNYSWAEFTVGSLSRIAGGDARNE